MAIKRGIAVPVEPALLEADFRSPGNWQYFWAFQVTIGNQGLEMVQLRSRHRMITHASFARIGVGGSVDVTRES
jgi:uncharacterized protein affecting Mg2+/Co2+ transport